MMVAGVIGLLVWFYMGSVPARHVECENTVGGTNSAAMTNNCQPKTN
jgi:hypothetical protein